MNEHIWYNPKVTIDYKSIFFKSFVNTGFISVGELLNIDGTFIIFKELKYLYPKPNFMDKTSLRNTVLNRLH